MGDEFAVGGDLEADEAGVDLGFDEDVVEREIVGAGAGGAGEEGAVGDLEITGEEGGETLADVVGRKCGEETEAAAVDSDDGDLGAGGLGGDAEEGAVAADDAAGVLAGEEVVGHGVAGGAFDGDAGGLREGDEGVGKLGSAGFGLVDHEGEFADGRHA